MSRYPQDLNSHARLQMLPKVVLRRKSVTNRKKAHKESADYILSLLKKWNQSEEGKAELWQEVAQMESTTKERSPGVFNRIRRVKMLTGVGRFADATKALMSCGVADQSQETLNELLAKFPQKCFPGALKTLPQPLISSTEDFEKALHSFPAATGSGRDGLKAQHLKDACTVKSAQIRSSLISLCNSYVNLLLSGKAPFSLSPFVTSAPVIPLLKKDGGIRPIAVGEIWRRVTSKIAARFAVKVLGPYLTPHQVGDGTRNGGEAVVHAFSRLVQQHGSESGLSCLKIDFKNAFNTIDRLAFFDAINRHCPDLSAWVEWCYGDRSQMLLGDFLFDCRAGVQQGDPLGPILFALALHPLVLRLNEECSDLLLNAWYLDDGTLVGPTDSVMHALEIIRDMSPELGLELNLSKCELWWPTPDRFWAEFPESIQRSFASGTDLLGSAVGDASFQNSILAKRVSKIGEMLKALVEVDCSQTKLHLLRSCIGFPKFSFALRTMHSDFVQAAIDDFDSLVDDALEDILGIALDDVSRAQIALPIGDGFGGFGIPSAKYVADAAFVASSVQSLRLQSELLQSQDILPLVDRALASLDKINAGLDSSSKMLPQTLISLPDYKNLQHELMNPVNKQLLSRVYEHHSRNSRSLARLNGCRFNHANDFLRLLPTGYLNKSLDYVSFQMLCRYHLGALIYPLSGKACSLCGGACDSYGDHASFCSTGGGLIRRHDRIRDYLAGEWRKAGFSVDIAPRDLLSYNQRKPGDFRVLSYTPNEDLLVDVSVVSSVKNLSKSSQSIGFNALTKENEKVKKYDQDMQSIEHALFVPFVMETIGGRSSSTDKHLKKIATSQAYFSGASVSTTLSALQLGLTAVFCREMARMWLDNLPDELHAQETQFAVLL